MVAPDGPLASHEPNEQRFATFVDALRWFADTRASHVAVWCRGKTLTWQQLANAVDHLSGELERRGVTSGERVALLSTPRVEYWVGALAIMNLGAVYVGLNPMYTTREIAHIVDNCGARYLFHVAGTARATPEDTLGSLPVDHPSLVLVDALPSIDDSPPERPIARTVDPLGGGTIIYTSGSTGAPKGALLSHLSMTAGALSTAHAVGVGHPRVLMNLPINHLGGLVDVCGSTLMRGGMIAFDESTDPAGMLRLTESLRLTNISHVPTVLQAVAAQEHFATTDLSSVEVVSWGGAPLPIDVVRAYRNRGFRLRALYGMTEISGNVCWTRDDADDETLATTVGHPNPFAEVKIVDEDGSSVGVDEDGEVLYRHPHMMTGYFGDDAATRAAFDDDGFYRTGDVGRFRRDGTIQLVGRRHDMFKSGGLNVYPREVEQVLEMHPAVRLAAVIGVPHPSFKEVGHAFVELDFEVSDDELADHCRRLLAAYKVPKRLTTVDSLPLLPVGKVDKGRLKREYEPGSWS
jgi:acyl-CoA synthetase (AMP-forming)/AMP-acid ligase II